MYELHGDHRSGNCWKAAVALELTGRAWRWRETDVLTGETRTAAFLALNPNGRVPLLRLPGGEYLAESNAILLHLAESSPLLPGDAVERARAYQWLFFEQYSHEPYLAVARFLRHLARSATQHAERLAECDRRGHEALAVMERALEGRDWFAGEDFSVADIALAAYTQVADEGGFDLDAYGRVRGWLERVAARPGLFGLRGWSP